MFGTKFWRITQMQANYESSSNYGYPWLIMDILNYIMGSDNRILKLEPSFLNKMRIPAG